MDIDIIRSQARGSADYGWLKTNYSFSFANYYNPSRMGFGSLRVINDDIIAGGSGFDYHPHDNMEIITVPLHGGVKHQDSMGNKGVVPAGDVQVMSAGTGIFHSEHNASEDEELRLFQIWIIPNSINVVPRYDQKSFTPELWAGKRYDLVGPMGSGAPLHIYQQAWISRLTLTANEAFELQMHDKKNGLYLMVIDGAASISGHTLEQRDAAEIAGSESLSINVTESADFLLIEVTLS